MDEKKMLREDMDAMSYREVIDCLRYDLDMRTFDPVTGETDSLFRLKNSGNKENYLVYVAICKCIAILERYLLALRLKEQIYGYVRRKYIMEEEV